MHKAREVYVKQHAQQLVERTGMPEDKATRLVERRCKGVLLADADLPFDDPELSSITVGNVLDNPATFEGMTLSDPIEGVDYGRGKAKIMRGSDGAPWIKSFAHGGIDYQLRYDYRAVRAGTTIEAAKWIMASIRCAAISAPTRD